MSGRGRGGRRSKDLSTIDFLNEPDPVPQQAFTLHDYTTPPVRHVRLCVH